MNVFLQMTKLSNIVGRADYITDPERQENILCSSPPIDFKPYQDYERKNRKSTSKNNEGRELMIALPTDLLNRSREEIAAAAHQIATAAANKDTDMRWALHHCTKNGKDNLHLHVVFSERQHVPDIKIPKHYTRDVYHTKRGTIARNKSERAKNPDGTDKPPAHRKGDVIQQGFFTKKCDYYKQKSFIWDTKQVIAAEFKKLGIGQLENHFKYYKQGRGSDSAKIKEKNSLIKNLNKQVDNAIADRVFGDDLNKLITRTRFALRKGSGFYPAIVKHSGKWQVINTDTLFKAIGIMLECMAGLVEAVAKAIQEAPESPVSVSKPSQPPKPKKNAQLMERLAKEFKEQNEAKESNAVMERLAAKARYSPLRKAVDELVEAGFTKATKEKYLQELNKFSGEQRKLAINETAEHLKKYPKEIKDKFVTFMSRPHISQTVQPKQKKRSDIER